MADKTHEKILSDKRKRRYAFWIMTLIFLITSGYIFFGLIIDICIEQNAGIKLIMLAIAPFFLGFSALISLVGSRLKMDIYDQYSDLSLATIYNDVVKFATLHNQFAEERNKSIKITVDRK